MTRLSSVAAVVLAACLWLAPPSLSGPRGASAQAPERYAAVVLNAASGELLFARQAREPRYPASITKVMTLYMVFEALETGRLSLEDRIVISPRAAGQPPSKLGLPAGRTLSVDEAIQALAVRSANDVAVALAEHLSGSVEAFGRASTARAHDLGMVQSTFVNPHGLPRPSASLDGAGSGLAEPGGHARFSPILCLFRPTPLAVRRAGLSQHQWSPAGRRPGGRRQDGLHPALPATIWRRLWSMTDGG